MTCKIRIHVGVETRISQPMSNENAERLAYRLESAFPGMVYATVVESDKNTAPRFCRVDIRRDDHEPVNANQVHRDDTIRRPTALCVDPNCDVKLPRHSHKI